MFDTMTVTKVLGATCGSLLVLLLGAWAAESLYSIEAGGHGEERVQAYSVDTGSGSASAEAPAADEGPDFETVLASADPAAGEKVFGKCKACHKIDGANATGPHLNGVVDRPKASVEGFAYSETLVGMKADSWTPANMNAFLTSPKTYAPGTKMAFAGLPKVEDRANVIAYLATLK